MSEQSVNLQALDIGMPQLEQATMSESYSEGKAVPANESGTCALGQADNKSAAQEEALIKLRAQAQSLKLESGWLEGSIVRQVPTNNFDKRPEHEISLIVVHCIALPPKQYGGPYVDHLFTGCLDPQVHPYFEGIYQQKLSSHLFINRQGMITQYVSFLDRAWHAGRSSYQGQLECNDYGIGIELEGAADDIYTQEQYAVLDEVVKLLKRTYPDIQDRIASHSEVAPGRKSDPGKFFDYGKIGYPQHKS